MSTVEIPRSSNNVFLLQAVFELDHHGYYGTFRKIDADAGKIVLLGPKEAVQANVATLAQNQTVPFRCNSHAFFKKIVDEEDYPGICFMARVYGRKAITFRNLEKNLCVGTVVSRSQDDSIKKFFPISDRAGIYSEIQKQSSVPLLDEWKDRLMDSLMNKGDRLYWEYDSVGYGCHDPLYIELHSSIDTCIEETILECIQELYQITEQSLNAGLPQ
jgi:hypothetical protein